MQNRLKKAGPGRPPGTPNRTTVLLKDALLLAATEAGGKEGLVGYLEKQALENPGPFMSLLGKVLPLQVTGADGGPVLIVTGVQRLTDEIRERVGDEANGVPVVAYEAAPVGETKEVVYTHPNSLRVLDLKARDENR
jgi:hypothetical protein